MVRGFSTLAPQTDADLTLSQICLCCQFSSGMFKLQVELQLHSLSWRESCQCKDCAAWHSVVWQVVCLSWSKGVQWHLRASLACQLAPQNKLERDEKMYTDSISVFSLSHWHWLLSLKQFQVVMLLRVVQGLHEEWPVRCPCLFYPQICIKIIPVFVTKFSLFWRPGLGFKSMSEMAKIFCVFKNIFFVSDTLSTPIFNTLSIPISDTLSTPIPIHFLTPFLIHILPTFLIPFWTPHPLPPSMQNSPVTLFPTSEWHNTHSNSNVLLASSLWVPKLLSVLVHSPLSCAGQFHPGHYHK